MLRALPPAMSRALEHDDLEAALDQLVRGAHAGDAAAQDDNPSRHASPSHDHLVRLLASFGGVTERAGRDTSDHSRRSHEHFQA